MSLPDAPPPSNRTATGFAVMVTLALLALGGALAVHVASGSTGSVPAGSVPGVTATPQPGPCVDTQQARSIWNDVNTRIDGLSLHPDLSRVGDVAEGSAADEITAYLQQQLLDHKLTERERERLDALTVVQNGCGGNPLTVNVSETVVQDDYLAPNGHVDHSDPAVGQTLHLVESYVRSGSTWKIITMTSLDQPTPSGGGNFV
jgi:hypothetical protein